MTFTKIAATVVVSLVVVCCTNPASDELNLEAAQLLPPKSLLREQEYFAEEAKLIDSAALEQLDRGSSGDWKTNLQGGLFVTAQKNAQNRLTVSSWRLNDDGSFTGKYSWNNSASIDRVAVVGLGLNMFVVATRQSGNLRLRSFSMDADGIFSLVGEFTGEAISDLAMTRVPQADHDVLHVALALRLANDTLKVSPFEIDSTGAFTARTSSTGGTVQKVSIASPLQPFGVVVTPVTRSSGALKLITHTADAEGNLTRRNELSLDTNITDLSASLAGYGRIAVGYNDIKSNASGKTWIRTYDVDNTGAITELSSGTWACAVSTCPKHSLDLVDGGGGRLFLVGSKADEKLSIRSFHTTGEEVTAMDEQSGDAVVGVSALVLKSSRLVTPVIAQTLTLPLTNPLQIIAWRDYSMPMVKNSWPESAGTPIVVSEPENLEETFAFYPSLPRKDLTIAAGDHYVIACGHSKVIFFDKAGNQLGKKHTNAPTTLTVSELFAPLLKQQKSDGSINKNNLLRYLEFQYACDPSVTTSETNKCPTNGFYDSSVAYDPGIKRFVILTQIRYFEGSGDKTARYALLAISKGEDPRDGFWLYGNAESLVRDMPQLGLSAGMVIVTWIGYEDSYLRPIAILYDISDLATGSDHPRATRITRTQTQDLQTKFIPLGLPGAVRPLAALGRVGESHMQAWFFKKDFYPPVNLTYRDIAWPITMNSGGPDHMPRPIIRLEPVQGSNWLAIGSYKGTLRAAGLVEDNPALVTLNVEVNTNNNPPSFNYDTGTSQIYDCPGTTASTTYRCSLPTLTVDDEDRALLVFGRERDPLNDQPSSWFGVHYFMIDGNTSVLDHVLQEGKGPHGRGEKFDFIESAVDPEGKGFWTIYKYADGVSDEHSVVAGRIMPD